MVAKYSVFSLLFVDLLFVSDAQMFESRMSYNNITQSGFSSLHKAMLAATQIATLDVRSNAYRLPRSLQRQLRAELGADSHKLLFDRTFPSSAPLSVLARTNARMLAT
eukprot:m.220861 g.220861  ORF g.220861 m.220861 type:complete len:108 (-) comp15118_c2_seq2:99-422(-)